MEKAAGNPSDEWFISIFGDDGLKDDSKAGSKHRPIQKVPARIREYQKDKKYFDPQVVSLGPYHHGEDYLMPMEKHKITAAKQFVDQSMVEQDRTQVRERFKEKVKEVIGVAKKCYTNEAVANLTNDAFSRMMFLDGCFVLYLIQGMNERDINMEVSNDLIPLIVRDMFLIENQLPFEVLDALMILRFGSSEKGKKAIFEFINWNVL